MSVLSFTWKGTNSDAKGVCVTALPAIYTPGEKYDAYDVPGADGTLRIPQGRREELILLTECYLPYEQGVTVAALREIQEWLRGDGWFTQSDLPGRAYRGSIQDAIAFMPFVNGFEDRVFSFTLYAKPFQYHWPQSAAIELTQAGSVNNPGYAASEPKITILGSGDITVSIGGQLLEFTGITGGVAIDSETRLGAYLTNGTPAHDKAAFEEYPLLQPGPNAVSWTGNVTKIQILPRWRD